jgi:imidazoleglycerol phosphate synthase glutamine amidotransferase subunit HisH
MGGDNFQKGNRDNKPITIRGKISADRQRYSKSSESICNSFLNRNKISENVEKMDANGIKYYDIQWSDMKYAKYANSFERTSTQEKYYGADSYGAKTEEEWKFAKIRLFEILKNEGFGWQFMKDKFKNTPAISSNDASYLRITWREL